MNVSDTQASYQSLEDKGHGFLPEILGFMLMDITEVPRALSLFPFEFSKV